MIKNKFKYDIFTIIIVVITLIVLALGGLILAHFIGTLGGELKDTADDMVTDGYLNQTNADYATDFASNDIPHFTDNYIFWFFVAVFIGLILTAMYLDFEPSIMIIIFIFGSIAVLGAWMGSQIYGDFGTDTELTSTNDLMTKTKILMGTPYFPVFIFIGLVVMMVIMYTKKRQGEYQ